MFRQRAWGLDLGRSAVKGVLVAASDDGIEVLKADLVPLEGAPPDPSQDPIRDGRLWRAVREFQQRHGLHREATCVAIPAQNTFVRDLTIATVSSRKAEEMVRYEAANEIPFVLDEVAWDYLLFDQQPGEPTRQGLLLAVKKNVIETYVKVFSQLEIGHVDLVTLAPLALLNFLRLQLGDAGRTLALDIGAENTDMLVLADGRFWLRSMTGGGNRVTALLEEEFDLAFEEAERAKQNIGRSKFRRQIIAAARPAVHELVRNVKTNLSYLERTGGPAGLDAAFVMGGAARLAGVREALGSALRQPARNIEELEHIVVSPNADAHLLQANLDRFAVAIGAALCGVGRDSIGVSFLPRAQMRVARISRSKRLLLGIGLVLWAAMMTAYVFGRQAQARVREPLREYRELATIASHNQRQLEEVLGRADEERDLQRLLALPRARTQPFRLLVGVVDAFSVASRSSPYAFRLSAFECKDVDVLAALARAAAPAGEKKRLDHSILQPQATEDEGAPEEEPGPSLLTGQINGVIRLPRGGTPAEGYGRFVRDLLPDLRGRPSLTKASAAAVFTKGSTIVVLKEGPWSELAEPGDLIRPFPNGDWYVVEGITSETELALAEPFAGEDCQCPCVITQVTPVEFNEETLEFVVRFVVPKEPATGLAGLLGGLMP